MVAQLKPQVEGNRIIISDDGTPHEYHVEKFGAKTTLDMLPHIMILFGEGVGELFEAMLGSDEDINGQLAGKAMDTFARRMLEVDMTKLAMKLLAKTSRQNDQDEFQLIGAQQFDSIYAGNLGELMKALAFVLEVNYAPFLRERLGDSEALKRHFLESLKRLSTRETPSSSGGE